MKNTVIKKFISNKIERNITKASMYGDIVDQIHLVMQIAKTNQNLKNATAEFMLKEAEQILKNYKSLYLNKKYIGLNAYSIYRLVKLKDKLSSSPDFEI